MEKSKIVFITHYSSMNGANQSLLTLITYLKKRIEINKVIIYGKNNVEKGLPQELKKIGIPYEVLHLQPFLYYSGFKSFLALPIKFLSNIPAWLKLYKNLENCSIDYIYSNSSVENTGVFIANLLGVNHIWHIREFGYRDYKYFHIGGDFLKRKIFDKSDCLIAISKSIASYIGLPAKTELIPNGIFYEKELENIDTNLMLLPEIQLGMVGLISSTKNQERALEVVHRIKKRTNKNVQLNFFGGVGDKNYSNHLKKIIEKLHLQDSVSFKGFVNSKKRIYSNIDILLMCSPNEAFGRVTVEAMAFGIPVIGYNNAGTAELISDGENGLLYDDETKSLEDCLMKLIENDSLFTTISEKAKISAHTYSVERYGESIFNLLSEPNV